MKEVCNRYADKMRGESVLHEHFPRSHEQFLYYPAKRITLCQVPGVATKSNRIFFFNGEPGNKYSSSQQSFAEQYPTIFKHLKSAIVVRHPLERLISVYRCVIMLGRIKA